MAQQVRLDETGLVPQTCEGCAPSAPVDAERLERVLRAKGHRMSQLRRLVLQELCSADGPITAEQIAAGLAGRVPHSSRASIYRNLEVLEQQGLLYHFHLGHGPRHYRLAGADDACYAVCERCQRVEAVALTELDAALAAIIDDIGFRPSFTHFPIVGVCRSCTTTGSGGRA